MTGGPRSDAVERFRALVARRLGLAFDEGRMPLLEQVLVRRADGAGAGGVDAYLARIEADGAGRELRALAPELTVGETYFFRNADQFSAPRARWCCPSASARAPPSAACGCCRPDAPRARSPTLCRS